MSFKTALQINLIIIIGTLVVSARAQERPSPEPAPDIILPTTTDEESDTSEETDASDTTVDESTSTDTEVAEVVTGTGSDEAEELPPISAPEGLVILAFDEVSIDETLGFIAEQTGKVVIPVSASSLRAKKITLRNDELVSREKALDLLFQAFRLNQVGVIVTDDRVIIGPLDALTNDLANIPIIGVGEDIMHRQDRGTLVIKVFAIERTEAAVIHERLEDMVPDYGSLTVYPVSNQIVLLGDVGLCQQIQTLIKQLDRVWQKVVVKTFRLMYADASEISNNILDLFEESSSTTQANRNVRARTPTPASANTQAVELRLTVNMQQIGRAHV